MGWVFTPILGDLVTVVSYVEDPQLKAVAYYKFISDFVNDLKSNNYTYQGKMFDNLRITGASLGGGLAIISGAQTQTTAVAISGINAVLARNT
jgi:lipase ATG15